MPGAHTPKTLYHGSKVADLRILKPNLSSLVENKGVVFVTYDIRFALAMIHATGEDLAVGYFIDTNTHEEEMYIEELQPGKLKLLENPGYIYEVDSEGFYAQPTLSHTELVKDAEARVIKMTKIDNVLEELEKHRVTLTRYKT